MCAHQSNEKIIKLCEQVEKEDGVCSVGEYGPGETLANCVDCPGSVRAAKNEVVESE